MDSKLPRFHAGILSSVAAGAQLYELSHAMAPSMPVYHQHIPFSLALHRRHGDPHPAKREDGSSFANEVIVTSGHSGTHIDALGHFSRNGCLHGGIHVADVETRDGYREHSVADIPPILQGAVVLDVAAAKGVDCLAPAQEITVADVEAALALSGAGAYATVDKFQIDTETANLFSSSLPWRQNEIRLYKEFPETVDLIVAVIDADTPEKADDAARRLREALTGKPLMQRVWQPDDNAFFRKNGLLFLKTDELEHTMGVLGGRREAPANVAPDTAVDARLAAIRGTRILLVEDNDINQQVARELLEEAGLVVEVADRGPGLPEGAEERIFGRFTRYARGSSAPGTGLGLSICRGVVAAHGGSIRAYNQAGGGSVFHVELPAAAQEG